MIKKYSLLQKIAAYGEFWFISGQAIGADGDTGDMNHEAVVAQRILQDLVEDFNSETGARIDPESIDFFHLGYKIREYLAKEKNDPENIGTSDIEASEVEDFIINTLGFDKDKLDVLNGNVDARDYGLKHLGWIRVKGNEVQTNTLTPSTLNEIGNGLYDAYDMEAETMTYNIEVISTGKYFEDVPWEVISERNIMGLQNFLERK